tara:strand:+ start:1297 stop:1461 length:165 start_codon:yes stop_codon:yes gene_type:complete
MSIYLYLAVGVLLGACGSYVAEKRGRSQLEGFILGFLLGIIGLIIEAFLPKKND